MVLHQRGEFGHSQYNAYKVLVSDNRSRTRAGVENGEVAENRTRSEGRKTDSIVGRLKKRASCPLSHDEYLPAGVAFAKNRVALPVRSTLQVRLDCRQVLRIELCEQSISASGISSRWSCGCAY